MIPSHIRGGVMAKGPMRPPTPPASSLGPGPGEYVVTEAVSVQLPGYIPLHMRSLKSERVRTPPPPTGKALMDYGNSRHLISVKNPNKAKSWEELARPTHTSCKPGARLIMPNPQPYKGDPYQPPETTARCVAPGQGRSVSSLGFYGGMVMGGLSRVGEQRQAHAPPSDDRVHSQISVFGGTQQSEQYGDARRVRHTPHPGGKMKSGMVRRYVGEPRKRSTSVMSFGATTEFSYAGGSQAMAASNTAWQNRDNPCALYSMWPQAEKRQTTATTTICA
eukprot:CAMPEP_0179417098 /NCGR_PEP_ID=MMETSP0799-20121207/7170_1 /TAXON_ID=46947 /ORGANISM="Geminigera cryophila, Strain CCMP2564" /LENGTH=276 /DNA_ID=CAMNT_0021190053 /DNA_START=256 /DNA_END=1082 /DNA_ORIENTATION=+